MNFERTSQIVYNIFDILIELCFIVQGLVFRDLFCSQIYVFNNIVVLGTFSL